MNQYGYLGLLQIIVLSLLLTAASGIFITWKTYSNFQANEDAHLTAIYLAQKELTLAQEHDLSSFSGCLNQQITLNNFSFNVRTTITTSGNLKNITTTVSWHINNKPREYSLVKTVYENE